MENSVFAGLLTCIIFYYMCAVRFSLAPDSDKILSEKYYKCDARGCIFDLTLKKPKMQTLCKVWDPNNRKQTIWNETKDFPFNYWVDVSDLSLIPTEAAELLIVDVEVEFADEETEVMYQEHERRMVDSLPEHSQNERKEWKKTGLIRKGTSNSFVSKFECINVNLADITFFEGSYVLANLLLVEWIWISILIKIFPKLLKKERFVVKKLISSKYIETT